MERWKHVRGYEGLYKVSDKGRVVGVKSGRMLKPGRTRCGYLAVKLCRPGTKDKNFTVHRLVAEAFVPRPAGKDYVNHIDEVKTNNAASNLEWVTFKENIDYSISRPVKQYDMAGNLLATFRSTQDAQRSTGVWQTNICKCCLGQISQTGGYRWRYANGS